MNLRHLLPVATIISASILGGAAKTAFAQNIPVAPIAVNHAWVDVTYRDSVNPADSPVTNRFLADPTTLNGNPNNVKVPINITTYWLTDPSVRDGNQIVFRPDFDPILNWDMKLFNATDVGYKGQQPTPWASITFMISAADKAQGLVFTGLASPDFRSVFESPDQMTILFSNPVNGPVLPGSSVDLAFQMKAPYIGPNGPGFTITSVPMDPNGKPVGPPAIPEASTFVLAAGALPLALGMTRRRRAR